MSHLLLTPCAKARRDLCSRHPTERRRMQSRTETEPFGPVAASGQIPKAIWDLFPKRPIKKSDHVNPDLRSISLFQPALVFNFFKDPAGLP